MVKLEKITKSFDNTRVLGPVDFELKQKDRFALIGESGSGKSTLIQILGCMIRPSEGSVLFDGKDVSKLSDKELSSVRLNQIGFVHQFFDLIPDLTALENICLPLWLAQKEKPIELAQSLLEEMDLKNKANQITSTLSGGEKQRVALARALVNQPKILLADEPTGSLDAKTSEQIMKLLLDFSQEKEVSLLVVTHSQKVAAYFEKQLVMKDGLLTSSPTGNRD
jgi:ABC-type lipoprotein export system ATPase subunit